MKLSVKNKIIAYFIEKIMELNEEYRSLYRADKDNPNLSLINGEIIGLEMALADIFHIQINSVLFRINQEETNNEHKRTN